MDVSDVDGIEEFPCPLCRESFDNGVKLCPELRGRALCCDLRQFAAPSELVLRRINEGAFGNYSWSRAQDRPGPSPPDRPLPSINQPGGCFQLHSNSGQLSRLHQLTL
ncbi:hypothetical protein EVAR_103959_1 [Eumeta japonica]|uniref:Uncharacterized protein n=1 Tax=Eumeta variegata TaxID=151549 RepID=A0A4C1YGW3_EUMVA|nr:hypothetical protein EVAR_103959_1 [Eumeta japonica]